MKQCVRCLRWKDGSEYRTLEVRHVNCWECPDGRGGNQYHETRDLEHTWGVGEEVGEYIYHYLSTHPCSLCGESDPGVLEFHYKEGKGFILSNIIGGGNILLLLQAEVSRCIVLCVNCHKKIANDNSDWSGH